MKLKGESKMYEYDIKFEINDFSLGWVHLTIYSYKKFTLDDVANRIVNFVGENWLRYCYFDMYEMLLDNKLSSDEYQKSLGTLNTVDHLGVNFADKKYILLNICSLRRDFCNYDNNFYEKSIKEKISHKIKIHLDL